MARVQSALLPRPSPRPSINIEIPKKPATACQPTGKMDKYRLRGNVNKTAVFGMGDRQGTKCSYCGRSFIENTRIVTFGCRPSGHPALAVDNIGVGPMLDERAPAGAVIGHDRSPWRELISMAVWIWNCRRVISGIVPSSLQMPEFVSKGITTCCTIVVHECVCFWSGSHNRFCHSAIRKLEL